MSALPMESLQKHFLAIRFYYNFSESCLGSSKRPQHPRGLGNGRSLFNRLRVSLEAIQLFYTMTLKKVQQI